MILRVHREMELYHVQKALPKVKIMTALHTNVNPCLARHDLCLKIVNIVGVVTFNMFPN